MPNSEVSREINLCWLKVFATWSLSVCMRTMARLGSTDASVRRASDSDNVEPGLMRTKISCIPRHADDLVIVGIFHPALAEMLPNRILILEKLSRKGLINYRDVLGSSFVPLVNWTSLYDRIAYDIKESRHNARPPRLGVSVSPEFEFAFH